jgi:hypothetical protein
MYLPFLPSTGYTKISKNILLAQLVINLFRPPLTGDVVFNAMSNITGDSNVADKIAGTLDATITLKLNFHAVS